MKLGFFTMPIHPLDKAWRLTLKEDREAFVLADELGFTEAYCGEHVTDQAENITSSGLFLSWIAKDIKRMRLGTGMRARPRAGRGRSPRWLRPIPQRCARSSRRPARS